MNIDTQLNLKKYDELLKEIDAFKNSKDHTFNESLKYCNKMNELRNFQFKLKIWGCAFEPNNPNNPLIVYGKNFDAICQLKEAKEKLANTNTDELDKLIKKYEKELLL